ncbi:MAG TPA: hypothetical protein ENK57_09335 [Polyangiaceae bacterium]|nr:hypothetical protein [Polyangiaceae bacterium]
MRLRLSLGLALLVAGCAVAGCSGAPGGTDAGPDAAGGDAGGGAARVELGTGTAAFEAIPETGGELELVGGPQGGFHVFVTARLFNLDPEGMTLRFSARDSSTSTAVGTPAVFLLVAARVQREGDHFVRVGDFLILDDSSPDAVRGTTLDITVTAEDADGRAASDERTVLIVDNVGG